MNHCLLFVSSAKVIKDIKTTKKTTGKKKEKKDYERLECNVHEMETETFICTSVTPNAPQTTEEDWENGGEVDGGSIDF